MDPRPIPFSTADLERRRLESTIDQDLHSLSLTTITSTTNTDTDNADDGRQHGQTAYGTLHQHQYPVEESDISFSSVSTIEYPRAVAHPPTQQNPDLSFAHFNHSYHQDQQYRSDKPTLVGPHGTPRAAQYRTQARKVSERSLMESSPVSTADHHVSAVTLAEGVFARPMGGGRDHHDDAESGSEWDPDRSLGRLVGELGKVMQAQVSTRPTSPFSPTRSPRSPSPYTTSQLNPNLSFTLNRADPLPSPPQSRAGSASGSGSSSGSRTIKMAGNTAPVPVQQSAPRRRALGESTVHNITQPQRAQQSKVTDESIRPKHVVQQGRPASAPARRGPVGDVTGMTGLLDTPDKGLAHGIVGKNGKVGGAAADGVPDTLSALHARLRALETENSVSRRRVRELENEVEKAKVEVESARISGHGGLQEVLGEKTALEDLVKSLRANLSRLTLELEQHKATLAELRAAQSQPPASASPPRSQVANELIALRREVERLSGEVHRLGGIVEQGLETRKKARGEETIRVDRVEDLISLSDEEVQRVQKDVEKRSTRSAPTRIHSQVNQQTQHIRAPSALRQGTHRAGSPDPELIDASVHHAASAHHPSSVHQPLAAHHTPSARHSQSAHHAQLHPTRSPARQQQAEDNDGSSSSASESRRRCKSRSKAARVQDGPSSPFPSIREEDEFDFFEASRRATVGSGASIPVLTEAGVAAMPASIAQVLSGGQGDIPPQTVLTRVIATLESDFKHYKAIYSELADQYKVLDAASAMAKRHVLAEHLKEVIDTLEQKADQIASLYTLLSFKDRTAGPSQPAKRTNSVPDVIRMVRDSLGEDGIRRLEQDGVIRSKSKKDRTASGGR